jgi:hypothetical protein
LAQQLQYEAAFAGEVIRNLYKLPASMRGIQSSGYRALSGQRVYLEKKRLSRMLTGYERINAPDNIQSICVMPSDMGLPLLTPGKRKVYRRVCMGSGYSQIGLN